MAETTEDKAIPNVVGRLDPVIDAIRAEDWDLVQNLVIQERIRLARKIANLEELVIKEEQKALEVKMFEEAIFNTEFRERILEKARK